MKIHHIGYLVKDIAKAVNEFSKLGFVQETEIILDEVRQISIIFLIKNGYRIELVSPFNSDSAIGNLYNKIGNSPYHICYEVDNIERAIKDIENLGYIVVTKTEAAPAINNCKVVFMFNDSIGIIELMEAKKQ